MGRREEELAVDATGVVGAASVSDGENVDPRPAGMAGDDNLARYSL